MDPELNLRLVSIEKKLDKLLSIVEPKPKTLTDASIEELVRMLDNTEPGWHYFNEYGAYNGKALEEEINRRAAKF